MASVIATTDLTTKSITGTGVFDELMAAVNVHLQAEYAAQRIRGPEYATVYLGAMQTVMQQSIAFLLAKEKAQKDTALVEAQTLQVSAQTTQVGAQTSQVNAQTTQVAAETSRTTQQVLNLAADKLKADQETLYVTQQKANAVIQGTVLTAQKCKLDVEYMLLEKQKLKVMQETTLFLKKTATEQAQTTGTGIEATSVIGKQIALYTAQTTGFARDAEQKAAKIMVDSWNVRRTTDSDATQANTSNKLDNANIGEVVGKLKTGIGL